MSESTSLGRSLQDVFARTPRREGGKGYLEVDIGLIRPSALNPRTTFDETGIAELAESIRQHGILQPLVVLKQEMGYEILAGERRWRAAKQAGLAKVPVVVRDEADPRHQAELRLVENIQRRDLDPMELSRAYQALIAEHGLTHEELAARLNKDRSSITNTLRLGALPEDLQRLVAAGELSAGHARALLGCSDPARMRDLARRCVAEDLSVRAIERLAKLDPVTAAPVRRDPNLIELEDNLRHLFGSRVRIVEKAGKGSITVDFTSKDHYQRVVTLLERFIRQANLDKVGSSGPPSRT